MRLINLSKNAQSDQAAAVALGFFDGVHLGHQHIISIAVDYARTHGIKSAVLTLDKHPRSLTAGGSPLLITDLDARLELFGKLGVDLVVVLDFNQELMNLSAEDYLQKYLVDTLKAQYISVGFDHHFGRGRSGTPELLSEWASQRSVELSITQRITQDGLTVSSSTIRSMLAAGDIKAVNKLLGREYSLSGTVVHGDGRGRELGFPTANIETNAELALPGNGVYIVSVSKNGAKNFAKGLVNVGHRPTFKEASAITVELYIPDATLDLYGSKLELSFEAKLRDEVKFEGAEQLVHQIERDLEQFRRHR